MILYALFAVVLAITSELYHRTTSRPAGAFRAAFHQETTAGHLAAGPDRIRRARRLIKPRFGLTLTIAHFIRSKPSSGILTRHRGICARPTPSGRTGKQTAGKPKTRRAPRIRPKNYINFPTSNTTFLASKTFGECVDFSKIENPQNP